MLLRPMPSVFVISATRVQLVYEVKCSQALSCSRGCSVGYKCSKDGCPTCDCIEPQGISTDCLRHTRILLKVHFSTDLLLVIQDLKIFEHLNK